MKVDLFIKKYFEDETYEIVDVWDEHCVAGNYEGYLEALKKARGDDPDCVRIMRVIVPYKKIVDMFTIPPEPDVVAVVGDVTKDADAALKAEG